MKYVFLLADVEFVEGFHLFIIPTDNYFKIHCIFKPEDLLQKVTHYLYYTIFSENRLYLFRKVAFSE